MQIGPCQHGATQQFPKTGLWRKEIHNRFRLVPVKIQGKGNRSNQKRNRKQIETFLPCQPEKKRPDDIKLFLDPQTPKMQKRLGIGGIIEIAALEPENEIGNKSRTASHMLAQLQVFIRQQEKPAESKTGDQNCNQDRINAADASAIKLPERKRAIFKLRKNNGRNQKTGNDEKDINPDKPTLKIFRKRMKKKNRKNNKKPGR